MVLKLFTPQESRTQNSAQNTRDALRTREIKKLLEKGHTEIARHEADFAEMMARHKEKWAKEEEAHAIRLSEMDREIRSLEERRKTALIPIEIEMRRADTMIADAEKRLGEVEKREQESESLKDVLIERIEQVSERESIVKDDEEKIIILTREAELEKETAKANTKNLSDGIEKFNVYVASETLILDGKRTEITLKELSIEARSEILDRKEKSLLVREAQVKDKQETLARAFDEFRRNTMSENVENTVSAAQIDEATVSGTSATPIDESTVSGTSMPATESAPAEVESVPEVTPE